MAITAEGLALAVCWITYEKVWFGACQRPQLNVLARDHLHVGLKKGKGQGQKDLLSNPHKHIADEQNNWEYIRRTSLRFSDSEWANNKLTN